MSKVNIEVSNNEVGAMVGDVLQSRWGYDQTNYDFYEVIKTTAKTVTLKKLDGYDKGTILKGKRTKETGNGYYVGINSFAIARFEIEDINGAKRMKKANEELSNPYRSQH